MRVINPSKFRCNIYTVIHNPRDGSLCEHVPLCLTEIPPQLEENMKTDSLKQDSLGDSSGAVCFSVLSPNASRKAISPPVYTLPTSCPSSSPLVLANMQILLLHHPNIEPKPVPLVTFCSKGQHLSCARN